MQNDNYGRLGMKWFNFFTKVRPWINFVICSLNVLSVFGYEVNIFDYELFGKIVILNVIHILGYVASAILHLILFFKANGQNNEMLLKYIKALLIFDIVFWGYGYIINQYYAGMTLVEIIIIAIVLLILEYFIWYRLNMKYFKKRLTLAREIVSNQSLSFENKVQAKPIGNYNVYGSDMSLQESADTEEKEVQTIIKPEIAIQSQTQTFNTKAEIGKVRFCSRCGGKIDNDTKKCTGCGKQYFKGFRVNKVLSLALIFLLILSGFLNVYLYTRVLEHSDEIAKLQSELTSMESKNTRLKTKNNNLQNQISNLAGELDVCYQEINFIDEFVVFVENDETDLYHKYQCYKFKGKSFWVFNVSAAIGEGYSPCPLCYD